jgi:hypothetical protein
MNENGRKEGTNERKWKEGRRNERNGSEEEMNENGRKEGTNERTKMEGRKKE